MASLTQTDYLHAELLAPRWSFASRIAFRFCFVYLGLYCLGTQIFSSLVASIPLLGMPLLYTFWPTRQIVFWTAAHIFGVQGPLVYMESGSGDKTFDWVFSFCLLILALAVTGIWSALDRRRENYVVLDKWFRLFVRFALASQMITYGSVKVMPLQMPFPSLGQLVEPYGMFSPMGVLWSSVGASPSYEIVVGSAELLGGILVAIPRTAVLGALVCLLDLVEIFILNMTYDVPVKQLSFHLILLALFLLAPEFSRLTSFFFLNRTTPPSGQPSLFDAQRANRLALAAQIIFGIYLVGFHAYSALGGWRQYGGGRPKPPLYGIWNIKEISKDGQIEQPLITIPGRWRRIIFDRPASITVQNWNDAFGYYVASVDAKTITLSNMRDKKQKAKFTFQRTGQDQLTLDGTMDQQAVHMQLELMDREKFLLVSRGFHWIQEYPFNR